MAGISLSAGATPPVGGVNASGERDGITVQITPSTRTQETPVNYRKTLPWLAAVACFATACGTGSSTGPRTLPAAPSSSAARASSASASEEADKALVLRLYTEAFAKNDMDVVKKLAGSGDVAEGQIKEFENVKAKIPGAVATVKHVAADGDLVAVHWHASATPANEATGQAKVDLYRVRDGKLTEHWGITQTVPAKTASGNSLFNDVYRYPKGAPALSESQEEANQNLAVTAYRKLSDGDATVIDKSWDPRYYQHNPMIANGTGPLKQLMQGATVPTPTGGTTRFGNTLADGDLVWVFSSDYAVADLFRVVDGKIIEHWDVVQDGQ
ncbi:SnoaL-like domain protein [Streptomyces acidiscabies]|nr:SnoaL-like domain protein [Streptomyces acidiscabies]GAV42998.1 SnoaL-like domain protein [Streptomyces acidiscabies]